MSILVIGVNHRSGPLSVLERVSLVGDELPKSVHNLASRDNVREVVVLSTCNRTEIYAVTELFHGAYADIRDFLCDIGDISPDDLHPHLYSQHDDAAVRHLFDVASGLDSAVVGESEILGQIRTAWEIAQREGGARGSLNLLFRHAIEAGKRARTETDIARGTASVSHAAVEMAIEHHGALTGLTVAVLGAGAMGEGIAVALRHAGVGEIIVVNRTAGRAQRLAERIGGTAYGTERLADALAQADLLLTSTGSGQAVVSRPMLESVDRGGRPLLIVDVAVPRDVAPDAAAVDGVTILDLDDLTTWAERGRSQRMAEVGRVEEIVVAEVDRFLADASALRAAPLVTALRARAEELRQFELERHARKLGALGDDQRELVEAITKGLLAKLLHEPTVRLRNQAGTPQGDRNAAAVADLFDLG